MIETSLRRFEVERKSYLASRPVFLLDQILHLVWLERTTVKYNTYKIVTFHPSQLLLHFQIHFLSTIWHFIEGHPSSTSKNIALFTRSKLRETVFWMVSVTPYLPQEASDTKLLVFRPTLKFIFILVCKKEILKLWTRSKWKAFFKMRLRTADSSQPNRWGIWSRRKTGRDARRHFLSTSNLRNHVSSINTHLLSNFERDPPRNI